MTGVDITSRWYYRISAKKWRSGEVKITCLIERTRVGEEDGQEEEEEE
jgi:hypothetical protein